MKQQWNIIKDKGDTYMKWYYVHEKIMKRNVEDSEGVLSGYEAFEKLFSNKDTIQSWCKPCYVEPNLKRS